MTGDRWLVTILANFFIPHTPMTLGVLTVSPLTASTLASPASEALCHPSCKQSVYMGSHRAMEKRRSFDRHCRARKARGARVIYLDYRRSSALRADGLRQERAGGFERRLNPRAA